jgi:CRISPR/Cas system-associated protein Cas5 (RAMP superfamily)
MPLPLPPPSAVAAALAAAALAGGLLRDCIAKFGQHDDVVRQAEVARVRAEVSEVRPNLVSTAGKVG